MRLSVLFVLQLGTAGALKYLPEHARGGEYAVLHPELLPPFSSTLQMDDPSPPGSVVRLLQVPLDHFDSSETRTFPLRYYVDNSVFDAKDGPLFIEMGGEGPCGGVRAGKLHEQHKAMAIAIEHRFYGESIPFNDRSVANLKYLSVPQNLADTAMLLESIQANLTRDGSTPRVVINFGGSYSGATSAWFREKYPNVTDGAVSSSGVVNAIWDFTAFDKQVAKAIDIPVPGCADKLRAVTNAFEAQFAAGTDGASVAKKIMNAANLIGTPLGDSDFWYMIADGAAMADQYGGKAGLCAALIKPYNDAARAGNDAPTGHAIMSNFANFTQTFWGTDFPGGCFYDSECLKDLTRTDMARSWRWQKCTEVAFLQEGYPGSLRHEKLSMDDLMTQCKHVFGDNAIAADCNTGAFNAMYGGATLGNGKMASKIVFLDYSDDPWNQASVQKPLSDSLPYCLTTCNGCGHCGAGVPKNLTRCQNVSDKYVAQWIEEATEERLNWSQIFAEEQAGVEQGDEEEEEEE